MSTPMTPAEWRSQLKKFSVPFHEMPGWDKPNSGRDDETGLTFGPVYGCVIHHTGSDSSDSSNQRLIAEGRSDLPGPLAQSGLNDDGTVDMHTCHRANHAGGGDPDVLRAVQNESYHDYPPDTDKHQGEAGAYDGNDVFYGLETYYSGGHPMTKAQYRSAVGWAAAICDFHGWSAKSAIGHKEWSDWKPDPGHVDMKVFRADVDRRIADVNATDEGPKFITPNITKAIAANIRYDKALAKVGLADALDEKEAFRLRLKMQRKTLRQMERTI